jgi:hypothetical protein
LNIHLKLQIIGQGCVTDAIFGWMILIFLPGFQPKHESQTHWNAYFRLRRLTRQPNCSCQAPNIIRDCSSSILHLTI